MDSTQLKAIEEETFNWLQSTRFASTEIIPVPGGSVNFTFMVRLKEDLEDGTQIVFIKHGEDFVRHTPSFKVSLSRVVSLQMIFKLQLVNS